jgi:hypothetical protein
MPLLSHECQEALCRGEVSSPDEYWDRYGSKATYVQPDDD